MPDQPYHGPAEPPAWAYAAIEQLVAAAMEAATTPSCREAHDIRQRSIEVFTVELGRCDGDYWPSHLMHTAWGTLAALTCHYLPPVPAGAGVGMALFDDDGQPLNPDDVARSSDRAAGTVAAARFLTAIRVGDEATANAVFNATVPNTDDDQRWVWVLDHLQTITGDVVLSALMARPTSHLIPAATREGWAAKRAHMAAAHALPPVVEAEAILRGGRAWSSQ